MTWDCALLQEHTSLLFVNTLPPRPAFLCAPPCILVDVGTVTLAAAGRTRLLPLLLLPALRACLQTPCSLHFCAQHPASQAGHQHCQETAALLRVNPRVTSITW